MNAMLLNLGLLPIPPTPTLSKPTAKPKRPLSPSKLARLKTGLTRAEASRVNQKIMAAKNLERAEGDRMSARDYIRKEKTVTVKALAWRFSWSDAKAADVMQILKQRGQVQKIGKGKAVVWGPV